MALLSVREEMDRGRPGWAFSNGFEYDSWSSIWCEECAYQATCPLLTLILLEMVPAAWEDRNPGALNRYVCHEYQSNNDDSEPTVDVGAKEKRCES